MNTNLRWKMAGVILGVGVVAAVAWAANPDFTNFQYIPYDHPAIQYGPHPVDDPVARLAKRWDSGKAKLAFQKNGLGYLPSLLASLDVKVDSQVLVFSKTSFQNPKISPPKPRAIYFNDNVAVGYVQGGDVLELMALDPKQGMMFYSLGVKQTEKPELFRRDFACIQCHVSPGTLNIPGYLISSPYPSGDGTPAFKGAIEITDHRTPLQDRWGGWYVSGTHGGLHHRGNAVAADPRMPTILVARESQNLTSLSRKFDTSPYLSPHSDIVALMTLEHQNRMTNLITRVGWETRIAAAENGLEPFRQRLDFLVDEIVTYMLFADEAPIREPIQGVSTFTKTFAERGPRDHQGRSLRDFDLQTRLFRYPLSYMIYSEAFDAIPVLARERIYQRLHAVLTGKDLTPKFARLSDADRRTVLEILRDTKPNLPAYWGPG
jgi:hypothetical protein